MDALLRCGSVWVEIPREERSEGEMLYDGELGKHLSVEHLDHALHFPVRSCPQKFECFLSLWVYCRLLTLLILPQPSRMPEMSYRMGLCSQKGPFLTSLMKPMAEKYMLVSRNLSTASALSTSPGLGARSTDPSNGMASASVIGRVNCAEPKMYGMKK